MELVENQWGSEIQRWQLWIRSDSFFACHVHPSYCAVTRDIEIKGVQKKKSLISWARRKCLRCKNENRFVEREIKLRTLDSATKVFFSQNIYISLTQS